MPKCTQPRSCAICDGPVNPDEAHWLHELNCHYDHLTFVQCHCDDVAHPDCCPELDCLDASETRLRLNTATWLLGVVAKKLSALPNDSVNRVLGAHVVARIKEFIAEAARNP